jgi:hypothetical protein
MVFGTLIALVVFGVWRIKLGPRMAERLSEWTDRREAEKRNDASR